MSTCKQIRTFPRSAEQSSVASDDKGKPRRFQSSKTPLKEPQISHIFSWFASHTHTIQHSAVQLRRQDLCDPTLYSEQRLGLPESNSEVQLG